MTPQSNEAGGPRRRRKIAPIPYIAIASIVSGIGGLLKLPSPVGSVALDAVPGLFSAVYYGPWVGGLVGLIGHLLSAATAGFPQGAVHILIAIGVGVVCMAFGAIARAIDKPWGLVPAGVAALILNNLLPFANAALGIMPIEAAITLVFPFLIVAAAINIAIACAVLLAIRRLNIPEV